MKKTVLALAACAVALGVSAKLAPPNLDPAAKAKVAETAAKAAWQAKVGAYELCKVEDKIAAKYGKHEGKAAGKATAGAAKPAASAASASGSTTPVAYSVPPPCADPGPFAYTPPEQKPLETSEAHSPPGTAVSPPSVRAEAAKIQPSGKTGTKK